MLKYDDSSDNLVKIESIFSNIILIISRRFTNIKSSE